jgi:hypothetical protein
MSITQTSTTVLTLSAGSFAEVLASIYLSFVLYVAHRALYFRPRYGENPSPSKG